MCMLFIPLWGLNNNILHSRDQTHYFSKRNWLKKTFLNTSMYLFMPIKTNWFIKAQKLTVQILKLVMKYSQLMDSKLQK